MGRPDTADGVLVFPLSGGSPFVHHQGFHAGPGQGAAAVRGDVAVRAEGAFDHQGVDLVEQEPASLELALGPLLGPLPWLSWGMFAGGLASFGKAWFDGSHRP